MLGILVACFSFYPPPICLLAVARQPNLTWWDSSGGYHEEDLVECEDAASKIIDDTCTPKPSLPDECDFNDEEQREYQIMAVATSPYPDLAFTHSLQRCASPPPLHLPIIQETYECDPGLSSQVEPQVERLRGTSDVRAQIAALKFDWSSQVAEYALLYEDEKTIVDAILELNEPSGAKNTSARREALTCMGASMCERSFCLSTLNYAMTIAATNFSSETWYRTTCSASGRRLNDETHPKLQWPSNSRSADKLTTQAHEKLSKAISRLGGLGGAFGGSAAVSLAAAIHDTFNLARKHRDISGRGTRL